jgi:hypothetical protein
MIDVSASTNRAGEFDECLHKYLIGRGWHLGRCSSCDNEFYSKQAFVTCQDYDCTQAFPFLDLQGRKAFIFLEDLAQSTREFFNEQGFEGIAPATILGHPEKGPFLISAGVQHFLQNIVGTTQLTSRVGYFIPQPSVRMQYFEDVGLGKAVSTSFVNVCTVQPDSTIQDFVRHLDAWLDYLSHVGLFVNHTTIIKQKQILRPDLSELNPWSQARFRNIWICYGGLELGDASFIFGLPTIYATRSLVDIGFGLERICWALNKTKSYAHVIGPFTHAFTNKFELLDSVRTMTLLSLGGVRPGREGPGYRLRQLIKRAVSMTSEFGEIEGLIGYYFAFWSLFLKLGSTSQMCHDVIREEFRRDSNIEIYDRLRLPSANVSLSQETETLLTSLVRKGLSISFLEAALLEKGTSSETARRSRPPE